MSQQPQIVCQVCFTQQDNAWDCVVCGSALHDKPRHWAVPVEQVEGLELTALPDAGNVMMERLPGLETNSADDGVEPLPEVLEGLELTSYETPAVATAQLPDFEPTALDAPAAPVRPGATACRYCGTPWYPGGNIFCARCGMRVGSAPRAAREEEREGRAACQSCGLPDQPVGGACRGCQQKVIAA